MYRKKILQQLGFFNFYLLFGGQLSPGNRWTRSACVLRSVQNQRKLLPLIKLQLPLRGKQPRPRTYRQKTRRVYLSFIKRKKPRAKLIRSMKKKLLNYLNRNFKAIALHAIPQRFHSFCVASSRYIKNRFCSHFEQKRFSVYRLSLPCDE